MRRRLRAELKRVRAGRAAGRDTPVMAVRGPRRVTCQLRRRSAAIYGRVHAAITAVRVPSPLPAHPPAAQP